MSDIGADTKVVITKRSARSPRPDHPAWISRFKARARDNRGVAVLEAAFVTPVFFILVLGIIEIGLVMNDSLALASSVRSGARTASASGNDIYADYNTVRQVIRESKAIDRNNIDYIVIYKANGFGDPPSATCRAGISVAAPQPNPCNVYKAADWAKPQSQWGCTSPMILGPDRYWCPNTRKVTLTSPGTEYVGVWMKIQHPWVTKMFGNVKTLTDGSVIRLEPRKL